MAVFGVCSITVSVNFPELHNAIAVLEYVVKTLIVGYFISDDQIVILVNEANTIVIS